MKRLTIIFFASLFTPIPIYSQEIKQMIKVIESLEKLVVEELNEGRHCEDIPALTIRLDSINIDQNHSDSINFDFSSLLNNYFDSKRIERDEIYHSLDSAYSMRFSGKLYGNNEEGLLLNTKALKIWDDFLEKELPAYITLLNSLAVYNSNLGNFSEAINIESRAIEIYKNVFNRENDHNYALYLGNLAQFHYYVGDYEEAIHLGTETVQIYKSLVETDDHRYYGIFDNYPFYVSAIRSLAGYYASIDEYTKSLDLLTNALKEMESYLPKQNDKDYALLLSEIAVYYYKIGDYVNAVCLGTKAFHILANSVCLRKESVSEIMLCNIMKYNFYLGYSADRNYYKFKGFLCRNFLRNRYDKVAFYASMCMQLYSSLISKNFPNLTENERKLFWDKRSKWIDEELPMYTYYIKSDSLIATTYDGELLSKGLLLNSEIEMNKLLLESGDSSLTSKYQVLQANRAQLNRLNEMPFSEETTTIDSLRRTILEQQLEIVQLSKTYGDYTKNLRINWQQVQEKLGPNDVAIEFLNFGIKNDSVMYVALTLTKDDEVPHMTSLFEKKELSKLYPEDYYDTPKLAELVWVPLSDVLAGKENIYFSPSGELYNIAIENVPYYDGEGLMSDHWNMYRLSSTRNLALIKDEYDIKKADVYGGLKYDMSEEAIIEDGERKPLVGDSDNMRSAEFAVRAIADSLDLRNGVGPLPATKIEAEDVEKKLVTMDVDSRLYTDTLGTETSFKALSGNKTNLIHIATHGFYYTESEAKKQDNLRFLSISDNAPRYIEDKVLTRSGLLMAGANYALEGNPLPENVNDGILTAKEISVMDLRGLDLVVLSACQTGVGEITGDGVFGLQRGFKKAGANTLLMSLWNVNDVATQMLMSQFYTNLALGETKYEALRHAQQYVKSQPNYDDPKYWAGFILLDATN